MFGYSSSGRRSETLTGVYLSRLWEYVRAGALHKGVRMDIERRTPSRRTVLAGLLGVLSGAGCTRRSSRHPRVRIATGSRTAVYYTVGNALASVINRHLPGATASVLVTAASAENVRLVSEHAAEIGFTQADILAVKDRPPPPLSALARVYDDLLHLVVRAGDPIQHLQDLRGKRVAVGAKGSGTAVTVERLLAVAQMGSPSQIERADLGLDDSIRALSRGDIDAFFFSGGLPVKGIKELSDRRPARIVDLSSWAGGLRERYSDVYVVRDVPTSVYHTRAVSTVAVPNLLVVATSMADDLAFDLTRLLIEQREALTAAHPAAERLDVRSAIDTLPIKLHPGAAGYYRSVKP